MCVCGDVVKCCPGTVHLSKLVLRENYFLIHLKILKLFFL